MSNPFKALATLFKAAAVNWFADSAQTMGAALAYYTIFSIAPLLLIVIAVAGTVFGEEAARGEIQGQLENLLGDSGAAAVRSLLESASPRGGSAAAVAFGVVLLFVGATTVLAELQASLDRIWRVSQGTTRTGLWGWVRARLLSFGSTPTLCEHSRLARRFESTDRGQPQLNASMGETVARRSRISRRTRS